MDEVLKALKADWVGYEEMRQDFINAPKYGNNDSHSDELAKDVYNMYADEMNKVKDINDVAPQPSGLIITWMFSTANHVGALPNGRKKGDYLTDGGNSPHAGYDKKGPMAAILSAANIDYSKQKAQIFNQKLSPATVEGEVGMKKFNDYVESIMDLGLEMVQFNVVDAATLKDAQERPEEYIQTSLLESQGITPTLWN
jgi:benzylsuccinate synthase